MKVMSQKILATIVMESNDEEKKDTDKYQGTQRNGDSRRWWFWCCVDKLTAITNDNYENELQKLYDDR